jgi:mono/diheme cytochrome c family protein
MSDAEVLPQQRRENPEPRESANPIPWWIVLLVGLLFAFGVVYIATARFLDTPGAWGDGRTRAELAGAAAGAKADGAAVYGSMCVACHQAGGTGLPGVFPPLAGSEWVNGRDAALAAIVLRGISGPLTVKGATYNGQMPSFAGKLKDEQIAAVLSHLRSSWGNASPAVSVETVAKVRAEQAANTAPFAGDKELLPLQQPAR